MGHVQDAHAVERLCQGSPLCVIARVRRCRRLRVGVEPQVGSVTACRTRRSSAAADDYSIACCEDGDGTVWNVTDITSDRILHTIWTQDRSFLTIPECP